MRGCHALISATCAVDPGRSFRLGGRPGKILFPGAVRPLSWARRMSRSGAAPLLITGDPSVGHNDARRALNAGGSAAGCPGWRPRGQQRPGVIAPSAPSAARAPARSPPSPLPPAAAAGQIMRMLPRGIARELYPLITSALRPTQVGGLTWGSIVAVVWLRSWTVVGQCDPGTRTAGHGCRCQPELEWS